MIGLFAENEQSNLMVGVYCHQVVDQRSHKLEDKHYIVSPIQIYLLISLNREGNILFLFSLLLHLLDINHIWLHYIIDTTFLLEPS